MTYAGDFAVGSNVDLKFNTVNTSGVPTTLAGGTVAAYPNNSLVELTAGVTLTTDFDGRTGLHHVRVAATTGNGYAAGSSYTVVVTAGTVAGSSIVGYVVGEFSLEARFANIGALNGDKTAAVNLELDYDGTGYAKATSSIGSITGNVGGVVTGGLAGTVNNFDELITTKDASWSTEQPAAQGTLRTGSTQSVVLLATTTPGGTDFYKDAFISFTYADGTREGRHITAYNATTQAATLSEALRGTPATTTGYKVFEYDLQAPPTAAEIVTQLFGTTVPASVAANLANPTYAQLQMMIAAGLGLFRMTISGNTITVYAPNTTTALMTWTVDSASAPTSKTRAT